MKVTYVFALLLTVFSTSVTAAPIPGTDIWVAALDLSGDTPSLGDARQLTPRPGYDNQPFFVSEQELLYTSMREGQTDIWRLDLRDGATHVLRETPESEYSPQRTPAGDITVVQVSQGGVQQLARLNETETQRGFETIFPDIEGVGYQAWLDADRVALFLIRDTAELHIANRSSGSVANLASEIGRSLVTRAAVPGVVLFSEPDKTGKYFIKSLDFDARKIRTLAPHLEGSMDFTVTPDGTLLMAAKDTVYRWSGDSWQALKTFSNVPGEITRLAVSPSGRKLVFVALE